MLSVLPAFSFRLPDEERKKRIFPVLKKGDAVAIVSPAGAVFDPKANEEFKSKLESLGFRVVLGKTTSLRKGYFAGEDVERAADLMNMFLDKNIRGIFCAKGGWGCARILPLLNMKLIRENPKVLIGFSDITSLLNAITDQSGLITYHGPVGNSAWNEFSVACFEACVVRREEQLIALDGHRIWAKGQAEGPLWGGNLSVFCSMIGTPWFPDVKDGILVLEETTEEPFRIDRMLTQLSQAGIFQKVKAIVFGKCTKCVAEEPEKAFTTEEVFERHFKDLSIPVVSGLPFGHTVDKLSFPIGATARLDTATSSFVIP